MFNSFTRRFFSTIPPKPPTPPTSKPTTPAVKKVKKVKPPKQPIRKPTNLLILSLGNPKEYNGTRHSIGHYVLDKLQNRYRSMPTRIGRFEISNHIINDTNLWFYRVPGYMNLSGKSVTPFFKEFTNKFKGEDTDFQTVILFDELDVDLGLVKIRKINSSHRGHNGLRDIQASSNIGKNYTGLQLGIGRYYNGDRTKPGVVADYVLSKFKPNEFEIIDDQLVDKVMDILEEMTNGKYIYDKLK